MSYQTIKKLLVERLPKLRELKFGCHIKVGNIELRFNESEAHNMLISLNYGKYEILGHEFAHADLLKVLSDDWAYSVKYGFIKFVAGTEKWEYILKCPEDLKELDNSEWKETSEKLISLITK